ncbi:class I SAM-dependent methyltransferase [Actinoplanes sp. NPDC089786]|uniref:class I SAM-dependent methyltransferase n=1 Tax=Actinoplanes sp. NPDC089786 TaxID=3155185 RepID=UPI00342A1825
MTGSRYAFDNDHDESANRHRHLAAMYDDFTLRRITELGLAAGQRCLELGAGGGSVAARLAGLGAKVLATDLNVRHLPPDGRYDILQHDLRRDPVPAGPWDLIHARLLLLHLGSRAEILTRLAAALAPGGVLLIEDFETTFRKGVLRAPTPADAAIYDAYHEALAERVMPSFGNDPTWAGRVHAAMLDAGLTDVTTEVHARSWPGGSAGALLQASNIVQQRAALRDAGLADADLDRILELLNDPGMVVRGHLLYSTAGRA